MFSEINEVPYKVAKGVISTPIGTLPAPGVAQGETAVLCIRERGIVLGMPDETKPRGSKPSDNSQTRAMAGRVLDVKFLGDVALLEVGVQGFDRPLRARARELEGWRRGAEVSVVIDPARALVFSANGSETR